MTEHRLVRVYGGLLAALLAGAAVAAVAFAKGSLAPTLGSAANAKLASDVVVDPHGRTLYALSSESSGRLLCKSAECTRNWPPYTVTSAKTKLRAAGGVQGRLGLVRRGRHSFQVTLRGKPLYRFAGDRGRDEDNGEGITAFGGTWHAVSASAAAKPAPTTSGETPAPYPPPMPPTYSYPSTPSTSTSPTTPTTTTTTPPPYTYPPPPY